MTNFQKSSNNFLLILQSNSPGEVSNWVIPFAQIFKSIISQSSIVVYLTPCQYASQSEVNVLKQSGLIDTVYSPKETLKKLKELPFSIKHNYQNGAVFFLGGDPIYSTLLSYKYKLPCFGYSDHNQSLGFKYTKTYKKAEYGNLMVEKVNQFLSTSKEKKKQYDLVIFTGSRPQHFNAFFPIALETVLQLKKEKPQLNCLIHISPFISIEKTNATIDELKINNIPYSTLSSLEVLNKTKLLLTLAGTNTAEAMYLKVPMLVLFPLNFPNLIILDGIAGLISKLPIVGILIKKTILFFLKKTVKFVSHPNRETNKALVPEIIDKVTAKQLSKALTKLLENEQQLKKIKENLNQIKHPKNVAKTIILDMLKKINYQSSKLA